MTDNRYYTLIGIHIALAFAIWLVLPLAKLVAILVLLGSAYYVIKNQNRNNEALLAAAYITGIEVFLRATEGVPIYEFGKYGVIGVIVIGMFYRGFSKSAVPMWIYLLALLPSLILAFVVLNPDTEQRKIISFVISGPICLGLCGLYTYQRKVSYDQFQDILLALLLPIISLTTYVILFNPSVREIVSGTDSDGRLSGGFGPNQVSTVFGLGTFLLINRALLKSPNIQVMLVNIGLAAVVIFRAIVTFSRGGVFTAIAMILAVMLILFIRLNVNARVKISRLLFWMVIGSIGIWGYSLLQTNGLIGNRYANKDALGRVKESKFTGREELAQSELKAFFENPILGVGVGKSIEIRKEETGIDAASHNEITRLLAEHGAFGILILVLLAATPIVLHLRNRQNFFMVPLLLFWALTINHAAMRIAAPAFVYSLALLYVDIPFIRRKTVS
ncbi:O-antigen ligase family protein [Flavobacterium aurantiibacter]|uniref:O-antigen ligase-related domain-containing protein n=1 Tax=Flavobacterium aurantiibacter TaxID=2023067 RepID=A0A255ZRV8_9FLAO|nr:O-antigen ligase family protein [Flavobacterium aurantiibacter]OYQ44243.1 hypothetical protein CHX27_08020 [Flavobacterium aurantiibacter]